VPLLQHPESCANAGSIFFLGLEKKSRLPKLYPFLRRSEMVDNVADEIRSVLVGYDITIKITRLDKIIINKRIGVTCA
jgi:hypothetical protein